MKSFEKVNNIPLITLFFLGVLLQFLFRQSVITLLPIPLHLNFLGYLGLIGTFGTFLELSMLISLSFILTKLSKLMYYVAFFTLISSLLPFIYPQYYATPQWKFIIVFTIIFTIIIMVKSTISSKGMTKYLLIPTLIMILLVDVESIMLYLNIGLLVVDYALLLFLSSIGFLLFTFFWGKVGRRKAAISYLSGLGSLILLLPLFILVSRNRFMEVIMSMVIPSITGLTLLNSTDLFILLISYLIGLYSIIAMGVKGNLMASSGYLAVITSVFLGLTGYHLILYLFSPVVGYSLMCSSIKESFDLQR